MNRILKIAVLGAAVAATTLTALVPADAGERWRHRPYGRPVITHHHSSGNDMLAAGVLGLAAGAIIAGIASQPRVYDEPIYDEPYVRPGPDRAYFPPAPGAGPDVAYGSLEPWTPEWYRYCSQRYRTFDARHGTFTGYDGLQHFCTAG